MNNEIIVDKTHKENIVYIHEGSTDLRTASNDVTLTSMYDFIHNDLVLAQYTEMIEEDEEEFDEEGFPIFKQETNDIEVGILGQDIIKSYNPVKDLIVNEEKAKKYNIALSCNRDNYTNVIPGALKMAILKIEQLEQKVEELESQLNK